MSIANEQSAAGRDADVVVIGAGPSGMMTANLLGLYGVRVIVLEAGPAIIDYPRGVGMDDETLRTFQGVGLADEVLQHTVPNQPLVFVDRKGRDLARIAPPSAEFGWPRRNGFVQPLADQVLLGGLARFPSVSVQLSSTVTALQQDAGSVTLTIDGPDGARTLTAGYVVGADGGSSQTRKSLGIGFAGTTATSNWLVVDIRNDPLGRPGSYVAADSRRPHVSISIPHGIRRFEFMLTAKETAADAEREEFIRALITPLVPASAAVDIIRRRVYVHHSRIAESFRSGRVLLVGDAAHVMPVWQGQGYNSGIRDALNLSWKLAMVIAGTADERVLDSYELERRDHVKAMVQLSRWVGQVISIRNPVGAAARDLFFHAISLIPRAKQYIVQMRFKPMPTMDAGALTHTGSRSVPSPVGRLFPQPRVSTRALPSQRLDDAVGPWFSLIAWNNDPLALLDADALALAEQLGIRVVAARPASQLAWSDGPVDDRVVVVGDIEGKLQRWFEGHHESVVLVRPDRIVGGASDGYAASAMLRDFAKVIGATAPREVTVR